MYSTFTTKTVHKIYFYAYQVSSNTNRISFYKKLLITFLNQYLLSTNSLCTSVHRRHHSGSFITFLSCCWLPSHFLHPKFNLFEWTEHVKNTWRQIRATGGMWQHLSMHFLQRSCCHSLGVRTRIDVEERDDSH